MTDGRITPLREPRVRQTPVGTIAVWTRAMLAVPHLTAFLGAPVRYRPALPTPRRVGDVTAMAGWGYARASEKARRLAAAHNLPYLAVESGFLRSLEPGGPRAVSCSLVVDATGIYYDATRPSDLEMLLNDTGWESPELLTEAEKAMDAVVRNRLSKYNHAPDAPPFVLTTPGQRLRVLLIDQPVGDHSVAPGMADAGAFARMLQQARRDHPGAALFIKSHPEVAAGRRSGYLTAMARNCGATVVPGDVSPLSLLAQADEVYTVTSQMGFEALLLGKTVHCFGMPFYAGWGLTRDAFACSRRIRSRTVAEVFAAAYMLYARYVNPVTGEPCSVHDAIRLLAEQRRRNEQNSGYTACLGVEARRRPVCRTFLSSTHGTTHFFRNEAEAVRKAAERKGRLAVPAPLATDALAATCARRNVPLIRLADGWLQCGALRAGRTPSLLRDDRGAPDDPSRPSGLEIMLQQAAMPEPLLARARALRAAMLRQGVILSSPRPGAVPVVPADASAAAAPAGPLPGERPTLLVAGSHADQPSSALAPGDDELLRQVRAARPDARILYLPPTESGPRPPYASRRPGDTQAADAVVQPDELPRLLPAVQEVHTVAALTGFDALLRNIPVHTYGGPFYAGWGLTTDERIFPRRSRPLTLDMLVAGALVLYPCHYDWGGRQFCGPEDICRLAALGQPSPAWLHRLRSLVRRIAGRTSGE